MSGSAVKTVTPEQLHGLVGSIVGVNAQCVALVRHLAQLPHTSFWRRGRRARWGHLAHGTPIATFDADGRYENATDGRSHAAIFVSENEMGLLVFDQWAGRPAQFRTLAFRGDAVKPAADNGDAFFEIVVAEAEDAA